MNGSVAVQSHLLLLKHPFYQAWMEGRVSHATLQDYARQYYSHVEAFPRYLENALALSSDPTGRAILSENLAEENGENFATSHPELWLRFAEGLGVSRAEVQAAPLGQGIKNVVHTFTNFSNSSLAHALGSLYAYESQVPEIAESKIQGLKNHYGISDKSTLAFFDVHKSADIEHRASLLKVIDDLPSDRLEHVQYAVDTASQALWDFLTDIQHANACQ